MDNNRKNDPNHNRQGWGIILITTLLVTFIVMGFYSLMRGSGPEQISYDKFLEMVDDGDVQEVTLNSDRIYITLTDEARREQMSKNGLIGSAGTILERIQEQMESQTGSRNAGSAESTESGSRNDGNADRTEEAQQNVVEHDPDYYTGYVNDYNLVQTLKDAGVKFGSQPADTLSQMLLELFLTLILPIGLMAAMLVWLMRRMSKGGGMMGIGPRCIWRKRRALHSRMWPGRTRQKNPFRKWWIFSIIRANTAGSVRNSRKAHSLWDRREPERRFLQKQ